MRLGEPLHEVAIDLRPSGERLKVGARAMKNHSYELNRHVSTLLSLGRSSLRG
jgi:hypothetical protein